MSETTNTAVNVEAPEDQTVGGLTPEDLEADSAALDAAFEAHADELNGIAPTTEQTPEATADDAEEPAAPTTEPQPEVPAAPTKLKFPAKYNHETFDVEVGEEDLPALWQKAHAYDVMKESHDAMLLKSQRVDDLAATLGYESADAMIDGAIKGNREERIKALEDNGTQHEVAEFMVDTQMRQAAADRKSAREKTTPTEQPAAKENSFREQVDEFFAARPDLVGKVTELPAEVTKAVVNGTPLRVAYAEYEAKQARAEQVRINEQNEATRHNADAAARAPVSGVSGDGTSSAKEDPWLKVWDEAAAKSW